MTRGGEEPRNSRPAELPRQTLRRAASGFLLLFTFFSLTPSTNREIGRGEEEPQGRNASGVPNRTLHKLILGLTFVFVVLALTVSSALVVYTAWLHDLKNGFFALVFAILSAQIAMNWLLWKDEEDGPEEDLI